MNESVKSKPERISLVNPPSTATALSSYVSRVVLQTGGMRPLGAGEGELLCCWLLLVAGRQAENDLK